MEILFLGFLEFNENNLMGLMFEHMQNEAKEEGYKALYVEIGITGSMPFWE